jgi:eukaryotic-like serine/threonine-protein kinase
MAGLPPTVGRYEILGEIGRGAMGVVYEARDPALDRAIALKVIQPGVEGDAARVFEERFLAEARIAAALQHPGIVVVHDVGRDPGSGVLFIALERLRGRTLADVLAAGPLDWRAAMRVVAQAARALHHAHLHGVVHRDVKPANVFVLESGEAKVMDFGIARLESARQRLTTTGEFIGTPLFTAPEQARTEQLDGRADVFSLGSVAWTLLTGRAAFMAPTLPGIVHRVVYEDAPPPSSLVRGLPRDVDRVIARALAKDPERRYPSAEAFAEDAEDLLAGETPRHAGGDDLVVVEEPDSPLAVLVAGAAAPVPALEEPPPPLAAGATRSVLPVRPPRRGRSLRRAPAALAAAGAVAVLALLAWGPWRVSSPPAGAPAPAPGGSPAPAPPPAPRAEAAPEAVVPPPLEPGRLSIDFDHPLRTGRLRVYVDDELALEERITGQRRKKALVFGVHQGTFREALDVAPGLHEVRVEVRWDDNVRSERIVGNFRPGATRRLDVNLGRIRRDLKLEWR